jgi:uncharacterized protein
MKFTADSAGGNFIRAWQPGQLTVRDEIIRSNAIISVDRIIADWQPAAINAMSIADFAPALELRPEIILLGTGRTQEFPHIALLTGLLQSGIAIEVMETGAACRTFNVLLGERRVVVAALLVG